MGIENLDERNNKVQKVLDNLTGISTTIQESISNQIIIGQKLTSALAMLESLITSVNSSNITESLEKVDFIKQELSPLTSDAVKLTEVSDVLTQSTELATTIKALVIEDIEKIYDGKTTYNYKCKQCSIKCKLPLKFRPLDTSVLKKCYLRGDNSAKFEESAQEA